MKILGDMVGVRFPINEVEIKPVSLGEIAKKKNSKFRWNPKKIIEKQRRGRNEKCI